MRLWSPGSTGWQARRIGAIDFRGLLGRGISSCPISPPRRASGRWPTVHLYPSPNANGSPCSISHPVKESRLRGMIPLTFDLSSKVGRGVELAISCRGVAVSCSSRGAWTESGGVRPSPGWRWGLLEWTTACRGCTPPIYRLIGVTLAPQCRHHIGGGFMHVGCNLHLHALLSGVSRSARVAIGVLSSRGRGVGANDL